jgi:hypothetical protein
MKQTLNEQVARIKSMMNLNEQATTDLKTYLDELLKDPVAFVNKLNTDEQFKNAYGSSYKGPDVHWDLLDGAKLQHLIKSGPLKGIVKNTQTNQVVREVTVNNMDEYNQVNKSLVPGNVEMLILQIGKLYSTPNGDEVAYALNVPLQFHTKNPNYVWFK